MRQLTLSGLALIASLMFSIAAASSAQALELKFLPTKATWQLKSNGVVTIERLNTAQVQCSSAAGGAETISESGGSTEVTFSGCMDPATKTPCTGLSDITTGNITFKGAWLLRHLLSPLEEDTILVLLISPTHYSCSSFLFTLSGCVASDDLKKDNGTLLLRNELVPLFQVIFLQFNGDAVVRSIDTPNALGMEECWLLVKQENGPAESEGLEGSFTAEKCELGGKACTFLVDLSGTQ